MKLKKDSPYEDVSEFMNQFNDITIDPSGTFYSTLSHNNVDYQIYGTPNFLEDGEVNFQVYIEDQETDFIEKDRFSFEELSKEDYTNFLNDVISKIKSKNLVRMNNDQYRAFLTNDVRDWGIDAAKEFCSNEMSLCAYQKLQNDELISRFTDHLNEESMNELNSCYYDVIFKEMPFKIDDDFYGVLNDIDLLKELD